MFDLFESENGDFANRQMDGNDARIGMFQKIVYILAERKERKEGKEGKKWKK